jgi:hypothetical protein
MNVNIPKLELKRINQRLPELQKLIEEDDSFIERGIYKKIFICVFDHWLTREEAENQIFIDKDIEELKSRRQKFKNFIEDIYNQTEFYTWKYKRHYRFHIQKPTSIKDVFRKCDFENLWSQSGQRYSFLLPEYSAVYSEEWDWTNIIWYINKEQIKPLLEKAKNIGLYILE